MKRIISLILAAAVAFSATGCSQKYEKGSHMFFGAFDTVITVISYQKNQAEFEKMADYVEGRYKELNSLYDIYNSYEGLNNIKTINDSAGKAPVEVRGEIIDLLKFSKEWYEKSGGKMNIAMGSVLKVWHDVREEYEKWQDDALYGTPEGENCPVELPDIETLRAKAEHIDINCVEIDEENMTVFITDPNVRIDVGAVAKGFATEVVADELIEMGYDNFAISAGGNVKTFGSPKDERARWGVGVENPMVDENYHMIGGSLDTAYFNTEMSLVCSGGYQRYMVIGGRRYHHLIDPITLYPEEVYRGVSVFCEDSGMADALSTAVFLMEPRQAIEFVDGIEGADCILVEIDGTVHSTKGVNQYLASAGVTSQTP